MVVIKKLLFIIEHKKNENQKAKREPKRTPLKERPEFQRFQ